ncbi:protein-ADP-ribose hydrolase [Lactobacillus sp.]|uniref:protein-ADP-ribose hydrolase n=1 Tax=Lactobacillus sp. TaxID=1591 RepID=UPI001997D97F|nr:protein-ADP-ribose hydrolase [Lactobacillus sp.]MBD5429253.1 protein-ADP-ribose hydrolase [Lactobacillus sp.]
MNQTERREYLIKHLLAEYKKNDVTIPKDAYQQELLLRALFNVREPKPIDAEFKKIQDEYLKEENYKKGIVPASDFEDGMSVWKGDITRLEVDAIVNAANSGMTGCYLPNHNCIDNAIHTYAGIELRNECNLMMVEQGHPEETGKAKITKAYNLPSKFVIHTVGPIVENEVTQKEKDLLEKSYWNCLSLAASYNLSSIAFPCISTGVFNFPNKLAAEIAVSTVKKFLAQNTTIKKVIFDVFKEQDEQFYEKLLN